MVALKGIPAIISPELLYTLAKMGHGDELVLADVNFPVSLICRFGPTEVRADGLGGPQLLEAILKLFPIDTYVTNAAAVMNLDEADQRRQLSIPVWYIYESLLRRSGLDEYTSMDYIKRSAFYERAKKAAAVVATGEMSLYGSLIIRKGVITVEDQK